MIDCADQLPFPLAGNEKGKAFCAFPKILGAGNEARTRDLNLGKVALYQLSYSRLRERYYRHSYCSVKRA